MKIKKVKQREGTALLFYSEQTTDDYLFNHQLSLVDDPQDSEEDIKFKSYQKYPESTLVSDRACVLKSISIRR